MMEKKAEYTDPTENVDTVTGGNKIFRVPPQGKRAQLFLPICAPSRCYPPFYSLLQARTCILFPTLTGTRREAQANSCSNVYRPCATVLRRLCSPGPRQTPGTWTLQVGNHLG